MRSTLLHLPVLFLAMCAPNWAVPDTLAPAGGLRRHELREAVEAHRTNGREQIRRDEAAAGRRLTPAERAELREQLRREWLAGTSVPPPPETQPAERIMPAPVVTPVVQAMPSRTLPPAARSQRP
jgi:hypothetical protein